MIWKVAWQIVKTGIRSEPAPSPDDIWKHIFADKNHVAGEE